MKKLLPSFLSLSLVAACFSLFVSSCSKNITCSDGSVVIEPVGFSTADFDSAFVVRYAQDNAFDIAKDTTHQVKYLRSDSDTGNLYVVLSTLQTATDNRYLVPGYDYKIFLPALGRIFAITDIKQRGNKTQSYSTGPFGDGKDVTCVNCVISYKLDGNPVVAASDDNVMPVFIKK